MSKPLVCSGQCAGIRGGRAVDHQDLHHTQDHGAQVQGRTDLAFKVFVTPL